MRRLPDALLEQHSASLPSAERPWQQVLRLNQALWREEQGYPSGTTKQGRPMGSMLDAEWAERTGLNLMSDAARAVAHREARADCCVALPGHRRLARAQGVCLLIPSWRW